MSLIALTEVRNVATAFAEYCRHFERGCEILEREVGGAAVSAPATLRWYAAQNFWAMEPQRAEKRFACAFGVDDPREGEIVPITLEINIPFEGIDRRCGGVFVRSNNGTIYLAHSGGIGGGRIGVGKAAFLSYYGDETQDTVTWPNKQTAEYLVIGALDDEDFRQNVADFVHKVACFKALPKK